MAEVEEELTLEQKISRAAREIMAVAGMNYTTARQHVIDALMKPKEIPNYDHVT